MPDPQLPSDAHPASPAARAAGLALLRLYAEWGVDEALGEMPVERFSVATAAVPDAPRLASTEERRPAAATAPATAVSVATPRGQAARAAALAAEAADLDALHAAMDGFTEFSLREAATHTVRIALGARPRLIVVGEVADRDEDATGLPFAGPPGALLDRMLGAIGLSREDCALLPAIAWRPPGNRTPTPSEIAACTPLLHRRVDLLRAHIAAAQGAPAIALLLGKLPARMLSDDAAVARTRNGTVRTLDLMLESGTLPAIAMAHPSMIAAQPAIRRAAWHGLLRLRETLALV